MVNVVQAELLYEGFYEKNKSLPFKERVFHAFKWKEMHGYPLKEQPVHPEVLWLLEEMAVDPTLNTKELQEVAPYPQKAYLTFYENTINGIPIEEYIIKFFRERKSMADFLDTSYEFIQHNHKEIIKTV